jgi:low affinity Fe/Cu permease
MQHGSSRGLLGAMWPIHGGEYVKLCYDRPLSGMDGERLNMNEQFRKISQPVSLLMGSPWAFILATVAILVWLVTGPLFEFSDTWQLVVNTVTSIVTFLMVFLIQNTQNRDAKAIHLKLDELIRSAKEARNTLVDLENLSDEELDNLRREFMEFRSRQRESNQNILDDGDGST